MYTQNEGGLRMKNCCANKPVFAFRGDRAFTLRHLLVAVALLCGANFGTLAYADESILPVGAREFQHNCSFCHMENTKFAPPLTKYMLVNREDVVRKVIMDGGVRMPGFKYLLSEKDVDAILAFLKTLDVPPEVISNKYSGLVADKKSAE